MATNLCLLMLALAGGVFAAANPEPLGLPMSSEKFAVHYWIYSLKSFVLPACLVIASWKQKIIGRLLAIGWTSWLLALSTLFIVDVSELAPAITVYGLVAVSCVLVISLAVVIFSVVELLRIRKKVTGTNLNNIPST